MHTFNNIKCQIQNHLYLLFYLELTSKALSSESELEFSILLLNSSNTLDSSSYVDFIFELCRQPNFFWVHSIVFLLLSISLLSKITFTVNTGFLGFKCNPPLQLVPAKQISLTFSLILIFSCILTKHCRTSNF